MQLMDSCDHHIFLEYHHCTVIPTLICFIWFCWGFVLGFGFVVVFLFVWGFVLFCFKVETAAEGTNEEINFK